MIFIRLRGRRQARPVLGGYCRDSWAGNGLDHSADKSHFRDCIVCTRSFTCFRNTPFHLAGHFIACFDLHDSISKGALLWRVLLDDDRSDSFHLDGYEMETRGSCNDFWEAEKDVNENEDDDGNGHEDN